MSIAERVARGASFLDEHDPDWWRPDVPNAIDLDILEMRSTCCCVLGQRCPLDVLNSSGYSQMYYAYALHLTQLTDMEAADAWAKSCGFDDYHGDWADITAEWTRVISERRAAAVIA